MAKQEDLRVFFSSRDSTCDECQDELGSGELIALTDPKCSGRGAHFKKVGRYNHKITSLDKPQKLVYYNPGLE